MAYRFTNTEKWNDAWFSELKLLNKALFLYLCDQCDIAGFLEINTKKIAFDLGIGKQEVEGALKGLGRGLLFSNDGKYLFLKNFIKHQKNLPLNEKNNAHAGIIKKLKSNLELFNLKEVSEYFLSPSQGANEGLGRGYGKGNSISKDISWKDDYSVYLDELNKVYKELLLDSKFLDEQQKFNPNVDILLTLEKSVKNFWGTEAGWKNKKSKRIKEINWKTTLTNAISQPQNKVYKNNQSNGKSINSRIFIEENPNYGESTI